MHKLNIRFYREKKGMTRAELGAAVGVSEYEIKAYEGGFESPKLDTFLAIAEALDVTPYDLAKGWD